MSAQGNPMESRKFRESWLKEMGKSRVCRNCYQGGLDLKRCIGCRQVYYCSKDCQVAHWRAEHKEECKGLAKRRKEESAMEKLQRKWINRAGNLLPAILVQCFTNEDFEQQRPNKDIMFHFAFNYNYGTFMLTRPPACTLMHRYRPATRRLYGEYYEKFAARKSPEERTHLIHIVFHSNGDMVTLLCNIGKDVSARHCKLMGFNATDVQALCGHFCTRLLVHIINKKGSWKYH